MDSLGGGGWTKGRDGSLDKLLLEECFQSAVQGSLGPAATKDGL